MAELSAGAKQPTTSGTLRDWCGLLWALLCRRCPRCRHGRLFRGLLAMNDPCPVCGLIFQREEGSFLGAMYVSYILSAIIMSVFYFALAALLPGWNGIVIASLAILPYLPFVPPVFQYSRALWIYVDRVGDFTNDLAGPYEKQRLHDIAAKNTRK